MPKFRFPIIYLVNNLSVRKFLYHHSPKSKSIYNLLGIFYFISTLSTNSCNEYTQLNANTNSLVYLCYMMFTISILFSLYMIWPHRIHNSLLFGLIWHIILIYNPIFCTTFFLLISKFQHIQLIIFTFSLLIIFNLCYWKIALAMTAIGISSALLIYKSCIGALPSNEIINNWHLFIYIALFILTLLIFFSKPNKEFIEQVETKSDTIQDEIILLPAQIDHKRHRVETFNEEIKFLNNKIDFDTECVTEQAQEIERLGEIAKKILNHLTHELHLPIGNVVNFSEILSDGLDKINKAMLEELADEVINNPKHLSPIILNILDLATLDIQKIKLNKKTMNLGELVAEHVKKCHKLYLDNKEIDIKLTIQPEVLIPVDPHYMRQIVDNLVINAIRFSDKGLIEIQVTRNMNSAILTVKDEGKSVSKHELYDLFKPFKIGRSKSEGRSVGLSLCRSAIKAHSGKIDVQNTDSGAIFTVTLPLKVMN